MYLTRGTKKDIIISFGNSILVFEKKSRELFPVVYEAHWPLYEMEEVVNFG